MTRQPIKTPCVKVCAVDGKTSLCLGCGRKLKEIGGWIRMTDAERDDVMADLPKRMEYLRSLGKLGPVT